MLVFFLVFCYLGPFVYHGPLSSNLESTNLPPGAGHPLGTDNQGFDVLEELMIGGRAALEIGFLSAVIGMVWGAVWGAVSGLAGGLLDGFLMRIVDVLLSIPFLFVVLIVAVRYGASVLGLSIIIGIFTWQVPARLVRGEVLTLRVRDFVSAARAAGSGRFRLMNRHLLPNSLGVIIVTATFSVADAILAVATLGFLGFGLQYPTFDWGDMLNNGISYLQDGYWWQIYPVGICNHRGRDGLQPARRRAARRARRKAAAPMSPVLEITNLSTHIQLTKSVVQAVGNVDLSSTRARPSAWWASRAAASR